MSYDKDLAKEYIRDAFHAGALDLGTDRKFLKGFVELFVGELDAVIAVAHADYLDPEEQIALLEIAKPTKQTIRQFKVWTDRTLKTR